MLTQTQELLMNSSTASHHLLLMEKSKKKTFKVQTLIQIFRKGTVKSPIGNGINVESYHAPKF